MTKQAFLTALNDRLQVLNKNERQDIIDEYAAHINMKVREGVSEEVAIAGFGDFDELVEDLLQAYHVNPAFAAEESDTVVSFVKRFGYFVDDTLDALLNLNRKEAGQLIVKGVILLIFVLIICSGIDMLISPMEYFVDDIHINAVAMVFGLILSLVVGLAKVAVWVYALYFLASRYVLAQARYDDGPRPAAPMAAPADQSGQSPAEPGLSAPQETRAAGAGPSAGAVPHRRHRRRSEDRAGNDEALMKALYFVVKAVVLVFILLPAIITMLSIFGLALAGLAGLIVGIPIVGPTVLAFGLGLLSLALIGLIWMVIYAEKPEKRPRKRPADGPDKVLLPAAITILGIICLVLAGPAGFIFGIPTVIPTVLVFGLGLLLLALIGLIWMVIHAKKPQKRSGKGLADGPDKEDGGAQ